MAKELERAGIPTALVTSLPAVAQSVGANRILLGSGMMHPLGDPTKPPELEREWRRRLVRRALEGLTISVEAPTVLS